MQGDPSRRPGAAEPARDDAQAGGAITGEGDPSAPVARLHDDIRGCVRCPQLVAGRTQAVPGSGAAPAAVMVVAEAPGAEEDRTGRPLPEAAERRLRSAFTDAGSPWNEDVYVTTLLKCHPPGNRDAAPTEVARCRSWLELQLELVRPRVLVLLGAGPTRALAPDLPPFGEARGRPHAITVGDRHVIAVPVLHPYAASYGDRAGLERDLAPLRGLLAAADELATPHPRRLRGQDSGQDEAPEAHGVAVPRAEQAERSPDLREDDGRPRTDEAGDAADGPGTSGDQAREDDDGDAGGQLGLF